MTEAFPGNSHKAKEQKQKLPAEKKIEKVVAGTVVVRKKPLGKRIKTLIFGGELQGAARYIVAEVALPAVKNLVVDATSKGIERLIYGEVRQTRTPLGMNRPRISYNSPVFRDPRQQGVMLPGQPPYSPPQNRQQNSNEVILSSREEAELVLERMRDCLEKFEVVTLADLYELVGLPSTYVDNQWGWVSLQHSAVRQVRDGYVIDFPIIGAITAT